MLTPTEAAGWTRLSAEEQAEAKDLFHSIQHEEIALRALKDRMQVLLSRGRMRQQREEGTDA